MSVNCYLLGLPRFDGGTVTFLALVMSGTGIRKTFGSAANIPITLAGTRQSLKWVDLVAGEQMELILDPDADDLVVAVNVTR